MKDLIANFVKDESGQGLVEYALIAALIAVAAIAALTFLGGKVSNMFKGIGNNMTS